MAFVFVRTVRESDEIETGGEERKKSGLAFSGGLQICPSKNESFLAVEKEEKKYSCIG